MPIPPMSLPWSTAPKWRVAETRAVNRALRKAYGIGICSVEEIGSFAEPAPSSLEETPAAGQWKKRKLLCWRDSIQEEFPYPLNEDWS
jgi:hypothetical protein